MKNSDDPLKYSNLKKATVFDPFDIFFILVALVVIGLGIYFSLGKSNSKPKFVLKNQLEKTLKDMDGIKSVAVEFHNGTLLSVLIDSWPGNYDVYKKENIEKIYNIIEEKSGIPQEKVSIYDNETGELIN